jgi:hypothetical protein
MTQPDPDILLKRAILCQQQHKPREAAQIARAILAITPEHEAAQLVLANALLRLGEPNAAQQILLNATHPDAPLLRERAHLGQLRQQGVNLWQSGEFSAGQKIYDQIHALESSLRAQYQPLFTTSPENQILWDLLVDVAGNYRLNAALNNAMPEPAMLQRAYLASITGNPNHASREHRYAMAATLHSINHWPVAAEICATFPTPSRLYQPSNFGHEHHTQRAAALTPRHIIKLNNALAYSTGTYLFIRSGLGHAPWLQEAIWGHHTASHRHFVLPPPISYFESAGTNENLGTIISTIAYPETTIDTPVVILGYWNNHGHVLHDILPQIQDAESHLGHNFHILSVENLPPSVQDAFTIMGYPPERFISIGTASSALLREAYCISPRTQHQKLRHFNPAHPPNHRHYDLSLDDAGLDFVRTRLQPIRPSLQNAEHKLYLSRRGTARHPDNEAELETLLIAQGFTIVQPEKLSLAEQIQLFAKSHLVIGLEGAALANSLFMPEGAKILTLRSLAWGWTVNCFDELARYNKLKLTIFDFAGRAVPLDSFTDTLTQLTKNGA